MKKYIVGITGASGSIYGVRVIEQLLELDHEVYLVLTSNGKAVLEYEVEIDFESWLDRLKKGPGKLHICNNDDLFAPIASGSFKTDGMVIVPCTMGTLSKLSNGITDNLLIRSADVMLKEKRNLVLVPRETPLNTIHLQNMLALSQMNVTILPPMPAFYNRPKSLDDLINNTVGRILRSLNVDNQLYHEWNGKEDVF